ncbi:MAG: flagellar hook-associated protein FlgL [Nitrospirae bacterium]|nr:flagellar hook-associated protein FlgL [Nitrospirota bacterium]MBF0541185.1 flagellar hook-associated protein FlgL [Nitrospirota bacterium]
MRVTSFVVYDRVRRSFQENWQRLYTSNEQLSSGKKVNRPSDDVIAMARILDYKLNINKNDQYLRNMDDAQAFLDFTDSTFSAVNENLSRLKELSLTAVTGSETPETRKIISKEVQVLKESFHDMANSKLRDRFIFAGYKTNKPAYDDLNTYQGDENHAGVYVNNYTTVDENINGVEGFSYNQKDHEVIPFKKGEKFIHYIPGNLIDPEAPANRVVVAVSTSQDKDAVLEELKSGNLSTVEDTFSFDNFMEMTQRLEDAMSNNDVTRMETLLAPVDKAIGQVLDNRAEVGARLASISTEKKQNEDNSLGLKNVVSGSEDADMAETTSSISKSEVALQALRQSSSNVISQTLFDFLR